MSYALAVLKYSAAVNASEVLEIDFGGVVPSNPSAIFFLNDFLSPDILVENNKILSSELVFKINDRDELKLVKDYQAKTIKKLFNGVEDVSPLLQLVSEKLGVTLEAQAWGKLVIDCVKNNINDIEQLKALLPSKTNGGSEELQKLIAQAGEGLTPDEQSKLIKLRQTEEKIAVMEKEVTSFQNQKKNKEDLKKNQEKVDTSIKSLEDKLASVNMLIQTQSRIKGELAKFNNITADNTIGQKVEQIKQSRSQALHSTLTAVKKSAPINTEMAEAERPLLVAKWMLVLVAVELVISLVFFVVSFQLIQLLIGIFSGAVIIILMLLVNVSRYSKEYSGKLTESIAAPSSVNAIKFASNPDEDKLMLNKAWSSALEGELKMINDNIESGLGGKSLEDIAAEKAKLLEEKKKLDQDVISMESNVTNTEDYYKKRRELDILKIEKENLEFSIESKMNKEIEEKIKQFGTSEPLQSIADKLPLLLINCKFITTITEFIEGLKKDRQVILINFGQ